MVKADPKRDYYADLELRPSADSEEIKKQFRLLAKLYHPDRNRGHEVEYVDKFQAIQNAHEILSDPAEKAKYDAARTKPQNRASAPPPPRDDPYNFRRPGPTKTQTTAPQSSRQPKPKPKPAFNTPHDARHHPREPPASAGAEKFASFARGPPPQTWTRERYEEAARAEAARGFSTMRSQVPPPQPPRPPRQHPTAPRPPSANEPSSEQSYSQNSPNPGFPGMARTSSQRRQAYPEEPLQRSAFSYVRAGRPPPATQPHGAEAYSPQSPQARQAASPLRHTRSTEYSMRADRPPLYARTSGRYSSNIGEKTDINGPGLTRSASVRNSPVDRKYGDEPGAFGRSHFQEAPPPRHHSASPKMRATSFSSSESSENEPIHMNDSRPKAKPTTRVRINTTDGLTGQFPSTNYTRVVDDNQSYVYYPPPQSRQPMRDRFPNMTSPDEPTFQERSPFSNVDHKGTKPEDVFRAANFSHQDWAERLKSTSPVKRGSRSKKSPMFKSDTSPDAMDVDSNGSAGPDKPQANGINLDDLKNEAPFKSEGLNGVDDLKNNLPFESRPSTHVRTESRTKESRLKMSDYPQPPKPVIPPSFDRLNDDNWKYYCRTMSEYMHQWNAFENQMIEHFRLRREQLNSCMNENWISMPSDGPRADQIDQMCGSGMANGQGGLKAGYGAYMEWLKDDELCHAWWDRACDIHKGVMEDLGQVRDKIKGNETA